MTPLETEADPNIRVGPLRWGRPLKERIKPRRPKPKDLSSTELGSARR